MKSDCPASAGTWPAGVGDAVTLIRTHCWANTSLGSSDTWPPSLKAVVDLALACHYPMVVLWGAELVQIYNDSYRKIMGVKHPSGMGQATRDCWPEVWHINEPVYERVLQGETVTFEDQLYPITPHGKVEDFYFNICYSPLRDESRAVAGVLVTVFDTTAQVNSRLRTEQRAAFLNELHKATEPLEQPEEITHAIARLLCDHLKVDRVVYCLFEPDQDAFLIASECLGPSIADMGGWHKLTDFGAAATECFRAGRLTSVDDIEHDARTAEVWAAYRQVGIRAHAAKPLLKGDRLVAALGVHQLTPRHWLRDELELIEVVAIRCWESLERARALAELRRQWNTFDIALSHTPDFIFILDRNCRFTYANQAVLEAWGRSYAEAIGHTQLELGVPEELSQLVDGHVAQVFAGGQAIRTEATYTRPNGITGKYDYVLVPVFGRDGSVSQVAGSTRDITERHRSEERTRAALIEREALLKEIHHRVKNNLQVIVSLLSLQADQISDVAASMAFQDAQSRVRTIARIHETLYSSSDLAQVEFGHYARVLVEDVSVFYQTPPDRIRLEVHTDEMALDIDQAIPLGLILNELVTNSLKHAFPGNTSGKIQISLRYVNESIGPGQTLDDAMGKLRVCDTGIGLSRNFVFETAESMGMYLVRILARQLHGVVELEEAAGTSFCLTFPLTRSYDKRVQ